MCFCVSSLVGAPCLEVERIRDSSTSAFFERQSTGSRDLMPVFQSLLFIMGFVFRSMASAMSCALGAASCLFLMSLTCEFKQNQ